ncbi:hypothetical protein BIY24_12665 [Halobacteriovorax marinus]|uniref:Uncharacterized protein n=1 Tax=Halobacteriovorax marinus (strain ATCC BAA-682 / DSM 15412 / SJ) TaxID=862908 RepID=E1WXF0_HALMS|nr:hypothetical protein [Halobacteriovorax marinus]ATH08768.1 hypothetical protein BIY24_12665 [Halobacteriovorax marinus]CBW27467.1 hypothetical protein BMS_2688 [Halobacteriovorax marinus SJ]
MKYQYKMATVVFTIFLVALLYNRYELEVYTWFCENEENGAACYVTHKLHQGDKSPEAAKRYLDRSCKLKYEMACDELNKK